MQNNPKKRQKITLKRPKPLMGQKMIKKDTNDQKTEQNDYKVTQNDHKET